jgi:4-hydroxyphenylpyruvate dioxygenase
MKKRFFDTYDIDYIEIYTPMAKALAWWHTQALGFTLVAAADTDSGKPGVASYVLTSGAIRLVLTSAYPVMSAPRNTEVESFIAQNYCGVKRLAIAVSSVKEAFEQSVANGAVPVRFPVTIEDEAGSVEEAAIKLYDQNEIVFSNRNAYNGAFKPGYKARLTGHNGTPALLESVDHIAAELRINEIQYWTNYVTNVLGCKHVQSISPGEENKTGMILNISQSFDKKLTLVMAEPESWQGRSKVQKNIDAFGPGIHHLAFTSSDLVGTVKELLSREVEFVNIPPSYYALLRDNKEFEGIDIDALEENGILIDKEDTTWLLQKFIKPISDRPFFFYEIVQRVNGYNGFALKNINVLKKAEEMEIMKTN